MVPDPFPCQVLLPTQAHLRDFRHAVPTYQLAPVLGEVTHAAAENAPIHVFCQHDAAIVAVDLHERGLVDAELQPQFNGKNNPSETIDSAHDACCFHGPLPSRRQVSGLTPAMLCHILRYQPHTFKEEASEWSQICERVFPGISIAKIHQVMYNTSQESQVLLTMSRIAAGQLVRNGYLHLHYRPQGLAG